MADVAPTCAHCGSRLEKWLVPEGTSWQESFLFVCFNDGCSYYGEGWDWMKQEFSHHASYRYAVNPHTGGSLMIPVWSASALRERIITATEGDNA